jgi:hypothetical protein
MKILRAEKFKPRKRSKGQNTKSETTLRKTDWEVLVQTDRSTGKLNLRSTAALKDPGSVKRLLEAGMIDPNGNLTAKGRKKCDGLIQNLIKPQSENAKVTELHKAEQSGAPQDKQIDKLTASDWAVLMKYDRNTGNLLTYDPVTNEMNQTSRAILKDPAIIQRLIDNNMILPGGWLTPEAKQECSRIEEKLKNQTADDYADQKGSAENERELEDTPQSKVYPEHQSKELPQKAPEKTAKPEVHLGPKAHPEAGKIEDTKPEAAADKVSPTYEIRQHYPDPKDKIQTKDEPKLADIFVQVPKGGVENKKLDKHEDLQAFFEQLPDDRPAFNLDPERQSRVSICRRKSSRRNLIPNPGGRKNRKKTGKY